MLFLQFHHNTIPAMQQARSRNSDNSYLTMASGATRQTACAHCPRTHHHHHNHRGGCNIASNCGQVASPGDAGTNHRALKDSLRMPQCMSAQGASGARQCQRHHRTLQRKDGGLCVANYPQYADVSAILRNYWCHACLLLLTLCVHAPELSRVSWAVVWELSYVL